MSAIALFTRYPLNSLGGLRDAAVPKKRWLGGAKDTFPDFAREHGEEVVSYQWSGHVLATLLSYLSEHGINLMKSELGELAGYLSEKRRVTCFILTDEHRKYLAKLAPENFTEKALCDFYNELNAAKETDVGKAMLDGIIALHDALDFADKDSVVLLSIG